MKQHTPKKKLSKISKSAKKKKASNIEPDMTAMVHLQTTKDATLANLPKLRHEPAPSPSPT